MSATKILWGQITIVALIVLFTTWGATQWTAWQLGFQPQLGHSWFELAGGPFYYPPAFFWWWYAYDAYAPSVFVEGAYIAASGGFISIAVAIGMSVWRAREAKNAETYGSARWAGRREVKAAGLLGADGVVLGKLERDYRRDRVRRGGHHRDRDRADPERGRAGRRSVAAGSGHAGRSAARSPAPLPAARRSRRAR